VTNELQLIITIIINYNNFNIIIKYSNWK